MSVTPTFTVMVSEEGKLQFPTNERRALDMWLLTLAGKKADVSVVEHEDTRSAQANRYYWSCVCTPVERANVGYTKEEFHDLMCERFLTKKHFEIVNRQTGEVEVYDIPCRSRKLKIGDFYRFVEQVRQFVAEFYELNTEDPDPAYWRKRLERSEAA